jgi:hypothetical protein
MTFSKRGIAVAAMVLGSSLLLPAAYASESEIDLDLAGCTTVFAGAAANPSSDAGPIAQVNIKDLGDGVHVYPVNALGVAVDYANHEASAASAYVACVV